MVIACNGTKKIYLVQLLLSEMRSAAKCELPKYIMYLTKQYWCLKKDKFTVTKPEVGIKAEHE
jgi:hypothetical protein